jgi:hypothetical protein
LSFGYGLAKGTNEWLTLFLRQDSGESFVRALLRNFDVALFFGPAFVWLIVGSGLYFLVVTLLRGLAGRESRSDVARAYLVLLVPMGLTALSVVSLSISPEFPFGMNLVVTLTLEGSFADLLTLGLFSAALLRAIPAVYSRQRFSSEIVVGVIALSAFFWATPARFYDDGVGQGNMFKYLRMAATVAGTGTLDISKVDRNPSPTVSDALAHLPAALSSYARESQELITAMTGAASRGRLYVGERTAGRANRSMFRSAEGGVYYINAPGPGLLLVPAYLVDRVLNRAFGFERQIAAITFWHLLGVLVVLEMLRSTRALAGGLAASLSAVAISLTVPILFYTFQIYPELPGALFLLYAFRKLVLEKTPTRLGILCASLAIAALPWMHQKYSVAAAILSLYAGFRLVRARDSTATGRERERLLELVLLSVPLAVSAYSIFLYNHSLTGSLSPTATFTSAGRSSFEPWNFVRGLLGLLFDRDNGLFVFAPLTVLSLAGLPALFDREPRVRLPLALVAGSYLLVIASFPYWPGAVSTMGRYISSVLPLLALPIVFVVRRAFMEGRVMGAVLVVAAASFAFSVSFARDLIPSYQPELLWGRVLYSDPAQYLPSLLSAGFVGSGPAHFPKLAAELAAVALVVSLILRGASKGDRDGNGRDYARSVCVGAVLTLLGILTLGTVLERWPANTASERARPKDVLALDELELRELTVRGAYGFEQGRVWVGGEDETHFELLTRRRLDEIEIVFSNGSHDNRIRFEERKSPELTIDLPPDGPHWRRFRLRRPFRFAGPNGERFIYRFTIHSEGGFVPSEEGRGDDDRYLGVNVRVR